MSGNLEKVCMEYTWNVGQKPCCTLYINSIENYTENVIYTLVIADT